MQKQLPSRGSYSTVPLLEDDRSTELFLALK